MGLLIKVSKIYYNSWLDSKSFDMILFENQTIREDRILDMRTKYSDTYNIQDEINKELEIHVYVDVSLNNKIFTREKHMKISKREKNIEKIDGKNHYFYLERIDWEEPILKIIKEIEKNFYLSEDELIDESFKLIKENYKYNFFKTQVEISGCIADGLAFVNDKEDYKCKIIGFEAKTNRDNYLRLYNQLNSYLSICDEVYLIVESKEIPDNLPFYVGVIRVDFGVAKVERKAISLKHDIDVNEFWSSLLKNLNTHIGLKGRSPTKFFKDVENIKRKLIWNQFVIGFRTKYSEEYVSLTNEEKNMFKNYFGIPCDYDLV